EASGWKGEGGSALASDEAARKFFVAVATEGFRQGRLMMLAFCLDGRPVAPRGNFLAGRGGFAFKNAFDERDAHFSPGVLIEIETIRRLHARPEIQWMDSCTASDNFMLNRLWIDRRTIQTLLVATGKTPGDLVVSTMPLLRWLNRKLLRRSRSNIG